MNARAVAGAAGQRRCCWSRRSSRCSRCCGCSRCRSCRRARPARYPPPLLPERADARQLPRAVRARGHGPLSGQQRAPRGCGDRCCRWCSTWRPATRSPSCASPAATASSSCCSARWSIPAQVAMLPLFLLLKQLGLVNTLRRRASCPAMAEHLRHLPRAPVRAVDSRRAARGRAHRRRERVAHLPRRSSCRC